MINDMKLRLVFTFISFGLTLNLLGLESNLPSKTSTGVQLAAKSGTKRATIEFEEQQIKGVRRIPLGSLITKERSNVKTELILMRKSWKSKIIASAKRI